MEQKQTYKGPFTMACCLMIGIGVIYFLMSASGLIQFFAQGGASSSELSSAALVFVLMLIGAVEAASGIMGLMSIKREKFRPMLKSFGYVILLMAVTYTVATVFLRGFQWSTTLSIALGIMYLVMVTPPKKAPQKPIPVELERAETEFLEPPVTDDPESEQQE